jgi:hypothetical protein
MKTLSKEHAKAILNWYDSEGKQNWGTWSNYPVLPVGASYSSFDTCHLRILFDEKLQLETGEIFNCIADSRREPGKNVKGIVDIYDLRNYIIPPDELKKKQYTEQWKRADQIREENETFNALPKETKDLIQNLLIELDAIKGEPSSRKRRSEIERELQKYPRPHFLENSWEQWIKEAWNFSLDEYIAHKMNS